MGFFDPKAEREQAEKELQGLVTDVEDMLEDRSYRISDSFRSTLESILHYAHDNGSLSQAQKKVLEGVVERWEEKRS